MAILSRIAVVSTPDTMPFVYGIRHAEGLCTDLLLCNPDEALAGYERGDFDVVLLPSALFPELSGADLLTDYCVAYDGPSRAAVLYANNPVDEIRRILAGRRMVSECRLAAILAARSWKTKPEWAFYDDASQVGLTAEGEALLLAGDDVDAYADCFAGSYDLTAEWHEQTSLPFVSMVWAARRGTPYTATDALEQALTRGVEHAWESLAELPAARREAHYLRQIEQTDYLFDEQKHRALRKFWDEGMKITPKVQPG